MSSNVDLPSSSNALPPSTFIFDYRIDDGVLLLYLTLVITSFSTNSKVMVYPSPRLE
jgi:hypothetical protein